MSQHSNPQAAAQATQNLESAAKQYAQAHGLRAGINWSLLIPIFIKLIQDIVNSGVFSQPDAERPSQPAT